MNTISTSINQNTTQEFDGFFNKVKFKKISYVIHA